VEFGTGNTADFVGFSRPQKVNYYNVEN